MYCDIITSNNNEIPRYKLDFELFGYSPDEYIKMGKPGPDDIVEEIAPKSKEEESKTNEEVAAAENESEALKVDSGVVEIGNEMEESEMKEDEPIGKST